MTRAEWKLHYRELRATRPKHWITHAEMVATLKDLYGHMYLPEEEAVIRLFYRYRVKIKRPMAYLRQFVLWRREAHERATEYLRMLVYKDNPLLALLPKDNPFAGKYIPVPIYEKPSDNS